MKLLKLFKKLWRYIKEDKWKFYIFIFLTFILTISSLFYAYWFGQAIDNLTRGFFKEFLLYLCLWDGYDLFSTFFIRSVKNYLNNIVELNFMKRISKDLYKKVINMPVKAYDDHAVSEYVNRIYTDPDKVIELLGKIVKSIVSILTAFMVIIIAMTTSWIITVELIIFAIVVIIISKIFYPKIKSSQERIKKNSDKYVSDATQTLIGVRDVKGLGLKKIVNRIMFNNVDNLYDEQRKNRNYTLFYESGVSAIQTIFEFIILLTIGYLAYTGQIGVPLFMTFSWYIWRLFYVATDISDLGSSYQKVVVSMSRINDILENKLYQDEVFGDHHINKIKGNIEFKDVHFSYEEDKKVLNGLSFNIKTGKKIAIVGKSGMGKSTIFNLLLRFYNPNNGEILIDNKKIESFDEDSLRNHISIIRQDPYIFNKTIKENFEMVKDNITLNEIRKVCKKAYIDDYIMSLPKQYDTLIGEGGVNLSGGQKQRLAIARTLVLNSKIILFDESTSSLDNESQAYIQKTIDKLVKNHTIIIIAHRLSTIMDADEIYLIDEGKIIASGKHADLMKNNKLYRKLYNPELMELNI